MKPCAACGLLTLQRHCAFCRRTIALIKEDRCVSCTATVFPGVGDRVEGKCAACLARNARLSGGTRKLLHQAANARSVAARRAA